MYIRRAVLSDSKALAEFNTNMARETEGDVALSVE